MSYREFQVKVLLDAWPDLISDSGARLRETGSLGKVRMMRRSCRLLVWRRVGLTLGFLVLLTGEASADLSVNNLGLYDGGNAPIVEIRFTGNSGIWVYGDPQTATNWESPNGSPLPVYCIDLAHDNYLGSSYSLTTWSNPNSFSSDAVNRIAWVVENASLSGYGLAAAQLLIWSIVDSNFQVMNWNGNTGNGSLEASYDHLASQESAAYQPTTNYLPGVQFFDAVHQPYSYLNQDIVVGIPGYHTSVMGAPEPSTLVIAGLGALGLIGYGCRKC